MLKSDAFSQLFKIHLSLAFPLSLCCSFVFLFVYFNREQRIISKLMFALQKKKKVKILMKGNEQKRG